jgi:hypothetical protein
LSGAGINIGAVSSNVTATCIGNTPRLTSGGANISQPSGTGAVALDNSYPLNNTTWQARMVAVQSFGLGATATLTVFAVCAP